MGCFSKLFLSVNIRLIWIKCTRTCPPFTLAFSFYCFVRSGDNWLVLSSLKREAVYSGRYLNIKTYKCLANSLCWSKSLVTSLCWILFCVSFLPLRGSRLQTERRKRSVWVVPLSVGRLSHLKTSWCGHSEVNYTYGWWWGEQLFKLISQYTCQLTLRLASWQLEWNATFKCFTWERLPHITICTVIVMDCH